MNGVSFLYHDYYLSLILELFWHRKRCSILLIWSIKAIFKICYTIPLFKIVHCINQNHNLSQGYPVPPRTSPSSTFPMGRPISFQKIFLISCNSNFPNRVGHFIPKAISFNVDHYKYRTMASMVFSWLLAAVNIPYQVCKSFK